MKKDHYIFSMNPEKKEPWMERINKKYELQFVPFGDIQIKILQKKTMLQKINFVFDEEKCKPKHILPNIHRNKFVDLLTKNHLAPRTWSQPTFMRKMNNFTSRRDKNTEIDLLIYPLSIARLISSVTDEIIVFVLKKDNVTGEYHCIDKTGQIVKRREIEISKDIMANYKKYHKSSLYKQAVESVQQLLKQDGNENYELKKCNECNLFILNNECYWGCNDEVQEPQRKKQRVN